MKALTPAVLVLVAATAHAQQGRFKVQLEKNGKELPDNAPVVLSNGTKLNVKAEEAVLAGWLNRMKQRGLIDTKGKRKPLFDKTSTKRAEAASKAELTRAKAQAQKVHAVSRPAATAALFQPLDGSRVPLTANPAPVYKRNSWGMDLGDDAWIGLHVSTKDELCSSPRVTYFTAEASTDLAFRGSRKQLAHGEVTVSSQPNLCTVQAYVDWNGQTIWRLNKTDERSLQEIAERVFPVHVDLLDFEVPTTIVPVRFRAWVGGSAGFAGMLQARQFFTIPTAQSALLDLSASSRRVQVGSRQLEGAFALATLSGQASMNLSLQQVANEFGVAGDIVDFLGIDANLGGASGTLSVDLVKAELPFDAWNSLEYYAQPGTQKYVLEGGVNANLRLQGLGRTRFEVSAWLNLPTGIDFDFSWDWPPVDVSISWDRLGYDAVWGSDAVAFNSTIPLLGERWSTLVQETHVKPKPIVVGHLGSN